MRLIICLYFLILCTIYIEAEKRVNKYVTTLIDAKWKETPLALEAAEYLNDENPSYFWKFIDNFANYDLRNGNFTFILFYYIIYIYFIIFNFFINNVILY